MNLYALSLVIAFLFLPLHWSFRPDIAYINCSTFEITSLQAILLTVCVCVCVCTCMCVCMHVCVHTCMCVCVHVHMCTFVSEAADMGRIQCLPGKSGRLPSISAKMQPTDHTSTECCQGATMSTSQTNNKSTVQTYVERGHQSNLHWLASTQLPTIASLLVCETPFLHSLTIEWMWLLMSCTV